MNLFELSYRSTPKREVFMAIRGSGKLKVEFYSHLDEIKDLYFNQGFVVFKILHQKVIDKYNLTLDYQAFCYYARRELKVKKKNSDLALSEKKDNEHNSSSTEEPHEPIIASFSLNDSKPFNPHTSPIDESRILR